MQLKKGTAFQFVGLDGQDAKIHRVASLDQSKPL